MGDGDERVASASSEGEEKRSYVYLLYHTWHPFIAYTQAVPSMELLPPPSRSPSPDLLPSDDEDAVPVIPVTLRQLPWNERYLPALPPKHTYLRTPVSPVERHTLDMSC